MGGVRWLGRGALRGTVGWPTPFALAFLFALIPVRGFGAAQSHYARTEFQKSAFWGGIAVPRYKISHLSSGA